MKIAVASLGYVGLSNVVLLAQHNEVVGVDVSAERVQMVNSRQCPIAWAAAELGIHLEFTGSGVDEIATVAMVEDGKAPTLKPGNMIMRIDPSYFRQAEVETLLGAPAKAKQKLGWEPEITTQEMCAEMVVEDLKTARRHALLKEHRMDMPVSDDS